MVKKNRRRTQAKRSKGRGSQPRKQMQVALRSSARRSGPNLELANQYARSLNDPFECEGAPLGWGCLIPTSVASAYLRVTVTSNADGSLALVLVPQSAGMLQEGSAGLNVALNAIASATDLAAIEANFQSGRVISMGIKAFPSIAATSAPGASFAGTLEGMTLAEIQALTPADLESFPQSQVGIASTGATATGRPVDVSSFAFNENVVNAAGWTAGTMPFSCPYISFVGLPGAVPVIVEVVINFEGIVLTKHGGAALGEGAEARETLALTWPNVEQVWAYTKPQLREVAQNTISSVATGAKGTLDAFVKQGIGIAKEYAVSRVFGGIRSF